MNRTPEYNVLEHIAQSHEESWNKDLALFIIKKVGNDFLKDFVSYKKSWQNWRISCNFFSYVNLLNIDSYYHVSNNEDYRLEQRKYISQWTNVLKENDLQLVQDITFNISQPNKKHMNFNVGINGLLAVNNPPKWFALYLENPQKYALNEIEEKCLAYDLLETIQANKFYNHLYDKKPELVNYLLDVVINHMPILQKELKKENDEFTSKIFNSEAIKVLINQGSLEKVSQLFNKESLSAIIKKSHLKDNLKNATSLLSNLLPIAESQDWVKAYKKEFTLFSFFAPLYQYASGHSFKDIEDILKNKFNSSNFSKKGSSSFAQQELVLQLEYFKEPIKEYAKTMSEKEIILWYASVLKCKSTELLRYTFDILPFPKINEESSIFYNEFYNKPVHAYKDKGYTWPHVMEDLKKEKFAKKMDKEMSIKASPKRVKI